VSAAISDTVWERLEDEFTLPPLEQVQARMAALHNDPEPVMRQLVRAFVRDGTYCPGFQFRPDGSLHPVVIGLFDRALALHVPHNYFAVWMITPLGRAGVLRQHRFGARARLRDVYEPVAQGPVLLGGTVDFGLRH
jgi:hypothetical protein